MTQAGGRLSGREWIVSLRRAALGVDGWATVN
jgi:hypothetical protein